jgi:predicted site-specific integrase-resolvase
MKISQPQIENTDRLSISQTACVLEVSVSSVRRWINNGQMRATINARTGKTYIVGKEIKDFWVGAILR